MTAEAAKKLKNLTIYSVYIRNYGKNGTFMDIEADSGIIRQL